MEFIITFNIIRKYKLIYLLKRHIKIEKESDRECVTNVIVLQMASSSSTPRTYM
jgi:hypothetical protein